MILYSLSLADCDDYDTDDSHESDGEEEEDDDDDVNVSRSQLKSKENTEHTNPTSYSWSILRLALIKNSTHKIQEFVKVAGIELQGESSRKFQPFGYINCPPFLPCVQICP